MLTTELLINRYSGETVIPKKLPLNTFNLTLAKEYIHCFQTSLGNTQGELEAKLKDLEGDSPDYKVKRGLAHLLQSNLSTFEIISPIEPILLRSKVFTTAAKLPSIPDNRSQILEQVALELTNELNREVLPPEITKGLYADLPDNRILTQFDAPTPEALIHRYNLSQVQGIFYRATQIVIHAHRNDPGQYKLLFRYLKLFQLMAYIEGDADTGFSITIDGPVSLFKPSTRYGLAIAKLIPALLHVSRWHLKAELHIKDSYSNKTSVGCFHLEDDCGLVSHYSAGKPYDSMIESSFAQNWPSTSKWRLEREVDLLPLPGGVMIPDFRLVHEDGRDFLLEIVGYWRPEYLQKKFAQVRKSNVTNLILAISERLNLAKAGVSVEDIPAKILWFKDKLSPKAVLALLDTENRD